MEDGDALNSLIEQFGPDGYCYEDSRVVDMLDEENPDLEQLQELLLQVKEDWDKDQAMERGMCLYNMYQCFY